jgi:hypothetical protein
MTVGVTFSIISDYTFSTIICWCFTLRTLVFTLRTISNSTNIEITIITTTNWCSTSFCSWFTQSTFCSIINTVITGMLTLFATTTIIKITWLTTTVWYTHSICSSLTSVTIIIGSRASSAWVYTLSTYRVIRSLIKPSILTFAFRR